MNTKLSHIGKTAKEQTVPAIFLLAVLVAAAGLIAYATGDTQDTGSDLNGTGKPPVNVSKYYDNETGVCQDSDIDMTNASELKQCVSNQTSVN